jgi:hypothetical protein
VPKAHFRSTREIQGELGLKFGLPYLHDLLYQDVAFFLEDKENLEGWM